MGVTGVLRRLPGVRGRSRRRVVRHGRRVHIEVRGLHLPGREPMVEELERALQAVDGVEWARVNGAVGRLVVALAGDGDEDGGGGASPAAGPADADVDIGALVDAVAAIEGKHDVADEPFGPDRPDHPGDIEPIEREAFALAADVAAVGLAVVNQMGRVARLPLEAAAVVPLVQSQPRLRHVVESVVGPSAASMGLAALNAMAHAIAQGPIGLVNDAVLRASLLGEHVARRGLWQERDRALDDPEAHAAPVVSPRRRPVPLPNGPVEVWSDRIGLASLAGFGVTSLATRDVRRGAAVLFAGIPKPATMGREAFAAHLGRSLAARGILCQDHRVLRRLDLIDCVVLDAAVIARGPRRSIEPAIPAAVRDIVDRTRRAGHMIAVAGDAHAARALGVDLELDGGSRLADAIAGLQEDGCVVALVTRDNVDALAAADCGIGVDERGIAHGAHICCPDLATVSYVIEGAHVAHEVSRQSVALSLGGSSIGALAGTLARRDRSTWHAVMAVNTAALVAQANALRAAVSLNRSSVGEVHETPAWHELPVPEVLRLLGTSELGLTSAEAKARRRQSHARTGPSFPRAVLEEMANPLTPVLAGAAGLSSAVGSFTDAAIVGTVTALNGVIGGAQRWRVARAVEGLERMTSQQILVRRDGALVPIPAEELVVGDVVRLEAGDAVPGDCRVIRAVALEVDESSITGESLPVAKHERPTPHADMADRHSMLFDGTTIAAGSVDAVVVALGDETEAGKAALMGGSPNSGGVEARLRQLTALTVPIALGGGALAVGAGMLRGRPFRSTLTTAVSLAVAAVPEGLPLLATMSQLGAARRLAARNALVRNPRAVEALGRVDVLCADKTGTLTEGNIELALLSDGEEDRDLADVSGHWRVLLATAVHASPLTDDGSPLPHLTDRAVIEGAARLHVNGQGWARLAELPFEPARGYHAVLGREADDVVLTVKGAPEVVIPRCDDWQTSHGVRPMDDAARRALEGAVDRLARRGMRVLAVARRTASSRADLRDDRVRRLTLIGFVGLADPVRPTAKAAVADLSLAGVKTVMLTGDHPSTAEGVAAALGILNGSRVMTGRELEELDDAALDRLLADISVFARVTPAHKVRLVQAYQRAGHAVAMTGDGANDAPAIRLADVGIALGPNSTSAARAAADLVVPDGRIETLLEAVAEGRGMWTSVREALAILLGGNIGEITFTVVGAAISGESPLNPRQLLLVNLLTDVLPAMAVATRMPPRLSGEQLLAEGPDRSLGRSLDHAILVRAATTTAGATTAWLTARATGTARRASTIGLVALVGTQLGQTLVAGGLDPVVLAASVGSAAALVAVVQTPGVCQFFGCTPLGPVGWTIAAASATGATAVGALAPVAWRALRSGSGSGRAAGGGAGASGDGQPQGDAGPAQRRAIDVDGPARALGRLAGDVQAQA